MTLIAIFSTIGIGIVSVMADAFLRPRSVATVEPESATVLLFDYHKSA